MERARNASLGCQLPGSEPRSKPEPSAAPSPVAPQAPLPQLERRANIAARPVDRRCHHQTRSPSGAPPRLLRAELELLRRAHAAYASQEYTGALLVLAEHAHRFPSGRLAEEREALRVRSLADVGRKDEARRAAANFAARFPRSVLLPNCKNRRNG